MKVVHTRTVVSYAGYVSQCQIGLSTEIIRRQDIVIHHRETDHGSFGQTLLQGHGELKALIENGVKSTLNIGIFQKSEHISLQTIVSM